MSATLRTPKIEALGKQILELQMLEVAELQVRFGALGTTYWCLTRAATC